jgi:hypothetical protein
MASEIAGSGLLTKKTARERCGVLVEEFRTIERNVALALYRASH